MAILTPVSEAEARTFLSDYEGLGALRGVVGIPLGTVNSSFALELDRRWFLRVYEEQDRSGAVAEAALLSHLAGRGVVTPSPRRRNDGGFVGEIARKPAALFPWCDGTMRGLAAVSERDAREVGQALAAVHLAGEGATLRTGRFRPEDLVGRLARIEACPEPAIAKLAPPLRDALAAIVGTRDTSLPRGLVHGDLFRDNVLFGEAGEITALLDFESASSDVLAFDVMVTVLAWCYRERLEPSLARAMLAGYTEVRPIAPREAEGMYAEGRLAALRFTITRVTDDAMRAIELGVPPRRDKDWRRFAARGREIEALGRRGLKELLGLGG
jgi:homoserine kinase type II